MALTPVQKLARAQGAYLLVGGAWPLLHVRSFEALFGEKTDRWLEYTVAGLMTVIGWSQWQSTRSQPAAAHARVLGVGTAATLLAIDLIYVPPRRIPVTFLVDAAAEIAWLSMWARTGQQTTRYLNEPSDDDWTRPS